MNTYLNLLIQIADGLALQFGSNCEIVIHGMDQNARKHSIVYIKNGHVTNRSLGDGPSEIVLEALHDKSKQLNDQLAYLTRTPDGRILKSSTLFIRDEEGSIQYILSINYDITSLLAVDHAIRSITDTNPTQQKEAPVHISNDVNELLDHLIEQSVARIGKPVALMNKEDKKSAISFLNDSGALLITKSSDKISKYFGISKFTLYSYLDSKQSCSNNTTTNE